MTRFRSLPWGIAAVSLHGAVDIAEDQCGGTAEAEFHHQQMIGFQYAANAAGTLDAAGTSPWSKWRLFPTGRRFWRADRGRVGGEGAGLGLSFVHAIIVRCRVFGSYELHGREHTFLPHRRKQSCPLLTGAPQ